MTQASSEDPSSTESDAASPAGTIGVYGVSCSVTGKSYIGWSKNVHNRIGWHRSHLRQGKHSRREMQADFLTHRESSFKFEVLVLCADENEAVREEARRIGESFKAGTCYNGIVPNVDDAKPRAKRQAVVPKTLPQQCLSETERLKKRYYEIIERQKAEYIETASIAWDISVYFDYQNIEEFLSLVAAFVLLTGKGETALCFNAVGDRSFVHRIRSGVYDEFPWNESKKVQRYIEKYMNERRQAFAGEQYFARAAWLDAKKADDAQEERAAA